MTRHPASYRDPSGFVYHSAGRLYRQVNKVYAGDYTRLMQSGLYHMLCEQNLLLQHKEINENILNDSDWHITLLPEQIPFTSYPSEWCFEQLKDVALLTLQVAKIAISKGMMLKDATPFNIQFVHGRPVFIDTLSFETYNPSMPWVAYRQFCETFLFPLMIAHYHNTGIVPLMLGFAEGIPVHTAAKLLPYKSRFNAAAWLHVYLQNKFSNKHPAAASPVSFSEKKMMNLLNHLESTVEKLSNSSKSPWRDYYAESVPGTDYLQAKEKIISAYLQKINGKHLLDLGANDGHFSILAAQSGFDVIAIDNDEQCINSFYKKIKADNITGVLPLCINIISPTPATGFGNMERSSFEERIKPDALMALALLHHLCIGKNIPLEMLASYFAKLVSQLIIEFVPKEDEKTQLLLQNKKDIFPSYSIARFEEIFSEKFVIENKEMAGDTGRSIYFMKRR
jgi:hypothetical protein